MRVRALFVMFVLVGSLVAQLDAGSIIRRVRVRVVFANGGCDLRTHVRLMGHYGVMAEGNVDDQCLVVFADVPVGTYHFLVSGETFKNTDSGEIAMNTAATPEYEVVVRRTGEPEPGSDSLALSAFVSAADLSIPRRAQKEFTAGSDFLARQDLTHAIQRFNKAIEIYPSYAGAYNSLGVIYSRLGDAGRSREALQKAIHTNDHFAMAYMNLGLLELAAGNFPAAENALVKADLFDPASATTLTALSYAQFMQGKLDDVLATSRKAHTLPVDHAFVHHLAARAYKQKYDVERAIEELGIFLKEEPAGTEAEKVSKELAELRALPHSAAEISSVSAH